MYCKYFNQHNVKVSNFCLDNIASNIACFNRRKNTLTPPWTPTCIFRTSSCTRQKDGASQGPPSSGLLSTDRHGIHMASPTVRFISAKNCISSKNQQYPPTRYTIYRIAFTTCMSFWQIPGAWLPTTRIYQHNTSYYSSLPASTSLLPTKPMNGSPITSSQKFTNCRRLPIPNAYQFPTLTSSQRLPIPNDYQFPPITSSQRLLIPDDCFMRDSHAQARACVCTNTLVCMRTCIRIYILGWLNVTDIKSKLHKKLIFNFYAFILIMNV